jgi:hypothetical protein
MDTVTELSQSAALAFFQRFARAIVAGDGNEIARCFELPAIFVSDDATMALVNEAEMRDMFAAGHRSYTEKGIVDTRPEIEAFSKLSRRLYEARVRWPGFDEEGREVWTEVSKYLLRTDDAGEPRIRVAAALGGRGA